MHMVLPYISSSDRDGEEEIEIWIQRSLFWFIVCLMLVVTSSDETKRVELH